MVIINMRNYYGLSCFLHGDYRAPWFDAEGHWHTGCPECAKLAAAFLSGRDDVDDTEAPGA